MGLARRGRCGRVCVGVAAFLALACPRASRALATGQVIGPPVAFCESADDCDDSDPCTQETCKDGVCVGLASAPDGTSCEDGNSCTLGDRCASGVCRPGVGGGFCPPGDACLRYTCDGQGGCLPVHDPGAACDDQDACTFGDTCNVSGKCVGKPVSCWDDACNQRVCNGTDRCKVTPLPGAPCNDGDACTHGEACDQTGACASGRPVVCVSDACTVRTCNGSPTCKVTVRPGSRCDDANLCTHGDTCTAQGLCEGQPVVCTSDETARRTCNGTATCTVEPSPGAACDDGDPCTRGDVRTAAEGCRGMPYRCPVTSCLLSSRCDGKGGCDSVARPDGSGCDADGSRCTPRDACRGGVCVPDRPVRCIERDCNTAACNPASGDCEYSPTSGGACGGNGCQGRGVCEGGACKGGSGPLKDCSSLDGPCVTGLCDIATGGCVAAPRLNGSACGPAGRCGADARCAFGLCELPALGCPPPADPCKVAACDATGDRCLQASRPAGSPCAPTNSCTRDATCDDGGRCTGSPAPNGQPCTDGAGQIGECAGGMCVVPRRPADAGSALPDGASDPRASGDAGPDGRDAVAVTPGKGGGRGGCHVASVAARQPGAGWAGAGLLLLLVVLARRRSV
jgi:hypothetical protein